MTSARSNRCSTRLLVRAVVVAVSAWLAGCAAPPPQDSSTPFADVSLKEPPSSYRGEDLLTPIVDVVAGSTRRLHNAIQSRIRDCIADAGFSHFPVPFPAERTPRLVDDQAWRAENAYGVALHLAAVESPEQDRNAAYIEGLTVSELRAFEVAMFGSADDVVALTNDTGQETGFYQAGGCLPTALEAEIGYDNGQMQYKLDVVEGRRNDAIEAMEADERWRETWDEWEACMSAEGWEFADRRSAIDHVFQQSGDDAALARRLEWQIVKSDDGCSLRLGTDDMIRQMRYSYQSAAIDSLATYLAELPALEAELPTLDLSPGSETP